MIRCFRVEAQIDVLRGRQRADEQPGDDEQRERAGDLADDQQPPQALAVDAVRTGPCRRRAAPRARRRATRATPARGR